MEARKENAILQCKKYNAIDDTDYTTQRAQLEAWLGGMGEKVWIAKMFNCDNGKNIFIGDNFTGNYNLTILDIREVRIGDNVMIGHPHHHGEPPAFPAGQAEASRHCKAGAYQQ